MTPVADVVEAGWEADPLDPGRRRWWDGVAWTAHVTGGALLVVPGAVAPPAATAVGPSGPDPEVAGPAATAPAAAAGSFAWHDPGDLFALDAPTV